MHLGLAQWQAVPGDRASNLADATRHVHALADRGCELVLLPELWSCGYRATTLADDVAATAEPIDGPLVAALSDLARSRGIWLCAGSVAESSDGEYFNTMPLFGADGDLLATHRKAHLYPGSDEPAIFAAGESVTVAETPWGRVGLSICFDGDHAGWAQRMRHDGVGLVLQAAAYETGAESWWDILYPAHALTNAQWWVLCNQSGGDCFGGSVVLDPLGRPAVRADRHTSGQLELIDIELDLAAGWDAARETASALATGSRPELYDAGQQA